MLTCCCCVSHSVVSNSLRPHGLQSTRLPCPWDSPGKNTEVGCHIPPKFNTSETGSWTPDCINDVIFIILMIYLMGHQNYIKIVEILKLMWFQNETVFFLFSRKGYISSPHSWVCHLLLFHRWHNSQVIKGFSAVWIFYSYTFQNTLNFLQLFSKVISTPKNRGGKNIHWYIK